MLAFSEAANTINSHLSASDRERLNQVFVEGLKTNDLQAIYFSALNLDQLTSEEKSSVCTRIILLHSESKLNVSH